MPVAVDLVVANPRTLRAAYTHIKVYRSATQTGTFVEVTTPTTRVPITNDLSPVFIDPTGESSNWYKISYWNQRTSAESAQSDAVQGSGDPALDVISVEALKTNFLFGIDLTDDEGTPYPDSLFRFYIQGAVSWLEHRLQIPLRRLVVTNEKHDFYREDFAKFQMIHLENVPVIEVTEVRIAAPSVPNSARAYPSEWVHLTSKEQGMVEIVPGSGALVFPALTGGIFMPGMYSTPYRSMPAVLQVDYVAGFEAGQIPPIIRELAGKYAALGPLNIAGDLVAGAGIQSQSLSMDGLSQNVTTTNSSTNAGYGARLLMYRKEIAEMVPKLVSYYQGIKARAV